MKTVPSIKNAASEKIKVNFYAGYRAEETPRSIIIGSREYMIEHVLLRKRILDVETGKLKEAFTCRIEGETVGVEKDESGSWRLVFPKP